MSSCSCFIAVVEKVAMNLQQSDARPVSSSARVDHLSVLMRAGMLCAATGVSVPGQALAGARSLDQSQSA